MNSLLRRYYRRFAYLVILAGLWQAGPVAAACPPAGEDLSEGQWRVDTVLGISICGGGENDAPLTDLVNQFLNILYVLAGLSAVLMIIFGGFRYITSAGDAKATQEAKETIQSAIMGLVLVLIAYLIAEFLGGIFGVNLLGGVI